MISDLHSTDKLHFAFHVIASFSSTLSISELDKNVEYIIIGDNTRKGTIVVVLATDTARVAFLVTVK